MIARLESKSLVIKVVGLFGQAELLEPASVADVVRDRKDNPFLALARAAGADYLVTEHEDLHTGPGS
jgi:predicted nucleic acid-binding protein